MNLIALKMLVGDRAKYVGIIMGLTFASLLITQQASIFLGLMTRTFGAISDTGLPDVWVMDPKVQFIDDIKPLQDTKLLQVRGIEGVAWAMPLYKGLLKARLENGAFQTCNVFGIDGATMIGGPPVMVEGRLEDLRRSDGVIVDETGASGKLARVNADGTRTPLRVGDSLELNDRRAVVVGICRVSKTFQSQPVIYTTYARAVNFAPRERKLLSFILVKGTGSLSPAELSERIEQRTGLIAQTGDEFKLTTFWYFMKNTGIPINFGTTVILGFVVGTAIAGQTFYNFTLDNIKQFGALKAMGAGNLVLLRMILLQAMVVGMIGYGLGVGLASFFGYMGTRPGSELAFYLPWQLLLLTAGAVTLITLLSALLSIRKVMVLEPAIVFKG
jgi:putative ABC transport system permease protein